MSVHASDVADVAQAPQVSESLELLDRSGLERRLRDSERHFRGWFEDAPVACHEVDRNGIVGCVNQAECELFGFRAEEMVGRPIWDFMSAEDRDKTKAGLLDRIIDEQPLVPLEREYKRRDGTSVVMEIHQKRIRDEAGHPVGLRTFLLDITQRKRAEQALSQQAEKLARSNAELEQFAYVASHDLQEPLRKIQAFADRLKTKCPEIGPEAADYLTRMQNAAARMQVLIQDLLSLSRVASQAKPFAPVDLNDVVRLVISDLEIRINERQGRVEAATLPVVFGDRGQLAQLFQNLIGNGLKFQKPGETSVVKINAQFLTDDDSGANSWRITVQDNGIGFDEKYRDRIFQIFQRLHGRTEYEGTGIGLAICRKIVDRHGGAITANSTPGAGAAFVIDLPHFDPGAKENHE